MQPEHLISVQEFCGYHQIDIAFVHQLGQRGLVQIITVEQTTYLQPQQLPHLEKLVRLHQDLAIHADDLDVVSELLEKIEALQREVVHLQNRLTFYEPEKE